MSKASILKMALENIARGVKKVDLGDLTRKPNVSERIKAIDRMVGDAGKKVASKVDDWGWKGGKPGELTGGKLMWYFESHPRTGEQRIDSLVPKSQQKLIRQAEKQLNRFREKYPNSAVARGLSHRTYWAAEDMGYLFDDMERVNIPREWTGKVAAALPKNPKYVSYPDRAVQPDPANLQQISNSMRQMTNDQRETFLALLPDWSGSLDELADAARKL